MYVGQWYAHKMKIVGLALKYKHRGIVVLVRTNQFEWSSDLVLLLFEADISEATLRVQACDPPISFADRSPWDGKEKSGEHYPLHARPAERLAITRAFLSRRVDGLVRLSSSFKPFASD